jgi:hypothetical protein
MDTDFGSMKEREGGIHERSHCNLSGLMKVRLFVECSPRLKEIGLLLE